MAISAIVLFYIGGWGIVWDMPIWWVNDSFAFDEHGFIFRFNSSYCGGEITDRFFNSPAISWVFFMLGAGGFIYGQLRDEDWSE